MSAESYSRWRSEDDDDDDDDETAASASVTIVSRTQAAAPEPPDLSNPAQARLLCIMALTCLVCVVVGVCIGRAWSHTAINHTINHVIPTPNQDQFDPSLLLRHLQPQLIQEYMRKVDEIPEDLLPEFLESWWESQGLRTSSTSFSVLLSKPDKKRPNTVQVTHTDGHQEVLNPLPLNLQEPPFSAYSGVGSATGPLVYGHYGRRWDLDTLQSLRINLTGAILLLRYGKLHDGAKIRNAEKAGAVGVLFYPDPADVTGVRGGGRPFPNGTGLPDDGLIWNSLSPVPGDPTTPFLPSIDHVHRKPIPASIPGQGVSGNVARRLLDLLGGPLVPEGWRGGLGASYRLGGSWTPRSTLANLTLTVNNILYQKNIRNIHATLPAADHHKVVMVGCHYGSLYRSPNAGLGSLLALSEALSRAYLPGGTQRQVVFSAWAAGHHGMVGSTEFSQLQSWWVDTTAMAYLSLDEMLRGTGSLRVMATPTLREAIRQAASKVPWPAEEEEEGLDVRQGWIRSDPLGNEDVHFSSLGSGSDFVSFTAQRGVPSAHFLALGKDWWSTYSLRHSQYDTREAYNKLLDPGCRWTHMLASLVGSVLVALSETVLPPVRLNELSDELYDGWQRFRDEHGKSLASSGYNFTGVLEAIEKEIITMDETLKSQQTWYDSLSFHVKQYPSPFPGPAYYRQVEDRLRLLTGLERGLLGPRGVGRSFATNLMVGPDPSDLLGAAHYPHVSLAIVRALREDDESWDAVHRELSYVLAALASYRELFPARLGTSSTAGPAA